MYWLYTPLLTLGQCSTCFTGYFVNMGKFVADIQSLNVLLSNHTGTNGGVSIAGTLASALGGLVVGCAFYLSLIFTVPAHQLSSSPPQWPILLVCTAAGVIGSAIDSVLGATVQYSGIYSRLDPMPLRNKSTGYISPVGT